MLRSTIFALAFVSVAGAAMRAGADEPAIQPPPGLDIPIGAEASEPARQPPRGLDISIGAGAGLAPDYEGSDDYEPFPLWQLRLGNLYHPATYVQVVGTRFESNLLPDDHFRLGIVATYLFDYDNVDDDRVRRLQRPDDALQAGIVLGYDFSERARAHYILELEASHDLLHGNGALITPRARAVLPLTDRLSLGGTAALTWASENYLSNRFGVSAADAARSGLTPFDADAGFKDFSLDVSLTYAFGGNWLASAFAGYLHLVGDAADSPIVADRGDRDNFMAGALIGYRF